MFSVCLHYLSVLLTLIFAEIIFAVNCKRKEAIYKKIVLSFFTLPHITPFEDIFYLAHNNIDRFNDNNILYSTSISNVYSIDINLIFYFPRLTRPSPILMAIGTTASENYTLTRYITAH